MTNRIEAKFRELKSIGRKAMIGFVTAGDPDLKTTPRAVLQLEAAGVDIVELGMPFSDPMADGPVIQKSSERALKSGTTLKGVLQSVHALRRQSEIPILLMGYYNPVFHYGVRKFFIDAKKAGVDGVLVVDLPPEEGEQARQEARRQGIALVFLLAPTSDDARIRLVNQKAQGFIYYVSLTGVTGAKLKDHLNSHSPLKKIRSRAKLPVCVGFGIRNPRQAREVAGLGDGVVVGSALVELFEKYPPQKALAKLHRLARGLASAVHSVKK